ncbi:MAG TPA: hemerythrin domain-containing protein [Burkholderiaceae bacterium]|nr:hemerythrin domain-containing protein [Burkholderiaceae bacterium]
MTTATKTAARSKSNATAGDAIALLRADHVAVSALFAKYEKTSGASARKAIVADVCAALAVHAQIEEEIFYPAVTAATKDKKLVPEATVEHAGVKSLIEQLEGMEPDGAMYDAKVKVLSEYVKHHVKEEQEEMFPLARAAPLDIAELGARMLARKAELLAERV